MYVQAHHKPILLLPLQVLHCITGRCHKAGQVLHPLTASQLPQVLPQEILLLWQQMVVEAALQEQLL